MSRLESISKEYRDCSLLMNSCRYTCGDEYCNGSADVFSDGDCRGRDPEEGGAGSAATVGTNLDISERTTQLAKNAAHYTSAHQYCSTTA
jgi:hypothetical protein